MSEKKLHVLYFTNVSERAGAEEHMLTLMRGLDRDLFELHVACPPELIALLAKDLPEDVVTHPLTLKRPHQLGAALELGKLLRRHSIDVLHSHLFYSSLYASPVGWLARVPMILETPHVREHWRTGWLKSRFFVDRLAGRFVDRFIAVSQANARYLIETKGLPPAKVQVILNGIDVDRFDPDAVAPSRLRQELGLRDHETVLTVLGRLAPQKGHRILFEALPEVLREHPGVRVVCVGTGPLASELERECDERGLAGVVHFAGYRSHVEDWLALSDVVILPSLYEGLPLAAIEASAAGRPVIASAVDGSPEVVIDGKTGLLVPPADAAALARAIRELVGSPERRRALGAQGRRWVEEHFSEEIQIAQTQQLYLEAVSHQPGRNPQENTTRARLVTGPARGAR